MVNEQRLTKETPSAGRQGRNRHETNQKTGDMVGVVIADEEMELMALSSTGKMIRVDMQSIRQTGRNASGVMIVRVDENDFVVDIARCPKEEPDEFIVDDEGRVF